MSNYPAHYMFSVQIWVTDITRSILVTSMGEIDITWSGERPKFKGWIVVSYIYTCTLELFFFLTAYVHFPLLGLKKIVPLRRIFNTCIFRWWSIFTGTSSFKAHAAASGGVSSLFTYKRKHVVLRVDLIWVRYFERMPDRLPFLWR